MDALLSAAVGFARLLLGALFLANLGTWLIRYSGTGQLGVIFALGAIAAAWLAQEQYFAAEVEGETPPLSGLDHQKTGDVARWLCIVLAALAFVCILLGP